MTCLNAADTLRLRQALDAPLDTMSTPTAGLFPEFEQLEAFAGSQLEDDFHTILARCALSLGQLNIANPIVPQDRPIYPCLPILSSLHMFYKLEVVCSSPQIEV